MIFFMKYIYEKILFDRNISISQFFSISHEVKNMFVSQIRIADILYRIFHRMCKDR